MTTPETRTNPGPHGPVSRHQAGRATFAARAESGRNEAPPLRGRTPALSPIQQLDTGSPWQLAFAERLRGPLDRVALRAALTAVVTRQEVLRWRILTTAGVPQAKVEPRGLVPLPLDDLTELPTWQRPAVLTTRLAGLAQEPFDPAGRLWRIRLYRLDADEHVLAFAGHHTVFDSPSPALLYADLAEAYGLALAGQPAELPPLPVTFGDYLTWRGRRRGRRADADLAWWSAHLAGAPTTLALPADGALPADAARAGEAAGFASGWLDPPTTAALGGLARSLGASLPAVLLAALGVVVARLTGHADFLVGTPTVDRRPAEFAAMLGALVDIAPLRLRPDPETSFASQVRQAQDELLHGYAHGEAPFTRLPTVQVLFEMVDAPALELPGLTAEPVPLDAPGAPVELTLRCVRQVDRLRLDLAYDAGRYRPERMAALLATLRQLVTHAVTSPDRPVGDLALRPADQPAPDRDQAVLDRLGRRAAVGELGEIAARWAGGWHGTGRTGRYRPDGTVEPAPAPLVRPVELPNQRRVTGPGR